MMARRLPSKRYPSMQSSRTRLWKVSDHFDVSRTIHTGTCTHAVRRTFFRSSRQPFHHHRQLSKCRPEQMSSLDRPIFVQCLEFAVEEKGLGTPPSCNMGDLQIASGQETQKKRVARLGKKREIIIQRDAKAIDLRRILAELSGTISPLLRPHPIFQSNIFAYFATISCLPLSYTVFIEHSSHSMSSPGLPLSRRHCQSCFSRARQGPHAEGPHCRRCCEAQFLPRGPGRFHTSQTGPMAPPGRLSGGVHRPIGHAVPVQSRGGGNRQVDGYD